MNKLDALKTLLGPKRAKRDAMEAELLEEYRGNETMQEIIKGAALGRLVLFWGEFCDQECSKCGSPDEEWRSDLDQEFYDLCAEIARIEREQCEILTNQQKQQEEKL